jgi:hypothetical protein
MLSGGVLTEIERIPFVTLSMHYIVILIWTIPSNPLLLLLRYIKAWVGDIILSIWDIHIQ